MEVFFPIENHRDQCKKEKRLILQKFQATYVFVSD